MLSFGVLLIYSIKIQILTNSVAHYSVYDSASIEKSIDKSNKRFECVAILWHRQLYLQLFIIVYKRQ